MVPGTTPIRLANFINLVRMARTLLPVYGRGDRETSGAGTGADLVQRVLDGSVRMGLSRNVRDFYGLYSQSRSPNLLVTAVAVENRHHLGRSDPPAGSSRATRMAPGLC